MDRISSPYYLVINFSINLEHLFLFSYRDPDTACFSVKQVPFIQRAIPL